MEILDAGNGNTLHTKISKFKPLIQSLKLAWKIPLLSINIMSFFQIGWRERERKCSIQSWQLWSGFGTLHSGAPQFWCLLQFLTILMLYVVSNNFDSAVFHIFYEIMHLTGPDRRLNTQGNLGQTTLQQGHSPFKVSFLMIGGPHFLCDMILEVLKFKL